jgi:hypothetical protein
LRRKYEHIPGPKTSGLLGFYLGNLVDIKKIPKDKLYHDLLLDWARKYGRVFKFQIVDRIIIMCVDPEATKEIFVNQNFPKHPDVYQIFGFPLSDARFLGNGLITELDEYKAKYKRHLYNASFYNQ